MAAIAHEAGHPADRRQHDGDAVSHPAHRPRRRHRRALGDQVHRRPRHLHRRRRRRRGPVRLAQNDKFPGLVEPDASYHGLKFYEALGPIAYIIKLRVSLLRDIGAALSPVQRLPLPAGARDAAAAHGAPQHQRLSAWPTFLEEHPKVAWVSYPGLPSHPTHELAKKYHYRGLYGAIDRLRHQGRPRGRAALRREHAAALAPGQHRRRQVAGHPPGHHDALAADRRGAARDRRHATTSCACRSASSRSTTSSPTSTRRWRRPERRARPPGAAPASTSAVNA